MKKLFFLAALAIIASSSFVNAQLSKGTIALTGGISYIPDVVKSTETYNVEGGEDGEYEVKTFNKSTTFTLKPGYVVTDNLIAGLFFSANRQSEGMKFEDVSTSGAYNYSQGVNKALSTNRSVGVFAKYFLFLGEKKNFALTGEGQIGFAMGKSSNETADFVTMSETITTDKVTTGKSRGLTLGIQPGLAFRLNDVVMFTTEYGFIGVSRSNYISMPDEDGAEWGDATTNTSVDADLTNFNLSDLRFGITIFLDCFK